MQVAKGSATVPVALLGVSPNSWCGRFHSPFGAPARVQPDRRRDADERGRDDRAPHQSTASFRMSTGRSAEAMLMKTWLCLLIAWGSAELGATLLAQTPERPKRNLLFIGQAKGYQHEAISTAMVTFYNLGQRSGLWNTYLRSDCTAITKKPLKWEAKNLDAFDAIVFFTDGELDMDASQKADLLSFIHDDGKGFIG